MSRCQTAMFRAQGLLTFSKCTHKKPTSVESVDMDAD